VWVVFVKLNGVRFFSFCNIDVTWEGWTAYSVLMVVHLLTDVVNGSKLIVLSGKGRNPLCQRFHFFFGGLFLTTAALITMYASTVYNNAIATSNRELIANAVIILFITDIDEMLLDTLLSINPSWIDDDEEEEEGDEKEDNDNKGDQEESNDNIDEVAQMKEELAHIKSKHLEMKRENLGLKREMQQVKSVFKTFCETLGCPELQIPLEGASGVSKEPFGVSKNGPEVSALRAAAGAGVRSRGARNKLS